MPKILYLVTEDWYFCSHRLPIARAARDAGFEVVVVTRVRRHGAAIAAEGFRVIPLEQRRGALNPVADLAMLWRLLGIYRAERPDLVHHVALKPVLYGTLASRVARITRVVNALGGLGYVFSSPGWKARLLRPMVRLVFRFHGRARQNRFIVQNPDDCSQLVGEIGVPENRIVVIRGSGVDTRYFSPMPEPEPPAVAALVSRMLWDKGVGEVVEAARMLKERGTTVKVVLVGDEDPENPESISRRRLLEWSGEGIVEWWGRRDDIAKVWAQCHICMLPSYREGLPKALLEAAACGRPIITTDTPGCREIVRDGENGILVPPRDAAALADAIERLVRDPLLRARMGARGRRRVEEEFSEERVVEQTLALYRSLLADRWPA